MGALTHNHDFVTVKLDRSQQLAWPHNSQSISLPQFVTTRDSFVRPQTKERTYLRVRTFRNPATHTLAFMQYQGTKICAAPLKVTVVPSDGIGLLPSELGSVIAVFCRCQFLSLEIALDFSAASGVDREFVLRHGLFGKSRPVGGRLFKQLRYGTRASETMVRAYQKGSYYRVEIELHSSWLRRNQIATPCDLIRLSQLLIPHRICFVRPDWTRLKNFVRWLVRSDWEERPLHHLLDYLRSRLDLKNVQRFLVPLEINDEIEKALTSWAAQWRGRQTRIVNQ